jgi:hypothetical protein
MKKIALLVVLSSMMLMVPVASYAIIDIGVYGGYNFGGDVMKPPIYGNGVGVIVHPSFTIAEVVTLGIGAFYQRSFDKIAVDYIYFTKHKLVTKDSAALDAYIQFNIPKFMLHPYGRVSTSVWDQVKGYRFKNLDSLTANEFFQTYSFGGGIAIPLASIPVLDKFYIYFEYLYNISKVAGDKPKSHTAQAGLKFMI